MKPNVCPNGSPCEFKGGKVCPSPNPSNRGKCVYYIPSPCEKCSLKGSPYIQSGNPESGVMVVGGSNHDSMWDGISALISSLYVELNIRTFVPYYYTTAVKCITDKKPSMALIKRCNSYLKEEIEIIKPKYVLVVGETAFKALLWDFDLITRRKPEIDLCAGSHIEKDGVIYFVINDLNTIEQSYSKKVAFKEHLIKFVQLINGLTPIQSVNYKEVDSEKDLIYIAAEAEKTGRISVDLEAAPSNPCTPFLPNSEILSISFTVKEGESFCIPMSWPTGNYFKKWDFTPKMNPLLAILYIKRILTNPSITKIFHNASFDITWLEHIFSCEVKNYDDTMIMKYLMKRSDWDPKGLKPLTKELLDMGYYEYQIKQYVGENEPYSNIPPEILMRYNNADTDATLRLWNIFRPQLKELKLEGIHYNFMIPNLRGIINLQKTGVALDVNKCIEMKGANEGRLIELYSELRTLPQVAKFERETMMEFMPTSDKHKFALVYGGEITTGEEMPRKINPKTGKKIGKKVPIKIKYLDGFNLTPITVSKKNTKTGKREERISFSKDAIKKYLKSIYKDIQYLDPINTFDLESLPSDTDIMKFIKLVSEIGTIQTQLSNHIEPFINIWSKTVDRCVHTSYDITGTTTGRLSCIAKGTMIEIVRDVSKFPKGIPIERVNVGDLAYTYDDNNNLCLKEVKWAGKTGHKKCVRVHWVGQGQHHKGYIDLTYDHKVRLVNGEWKEAGKLNKNDRILALSRSKTSGYSRLHCYKNKELRDHVFIAKHFKQVPANYHVHHKDFNKLNNEPNNFQILSQAEHNRLHYSNLSIERKREITYNILGYDRSKINWKEVGLNKRLKNRPLKFTLLRMLANCGGRLLTASKQYGYDFNTFKWYIQSYGIEWREVRHKYGADSKFLSKGRVNKIVKEFKTIPKVSKELRVGTDLAKFYISNNNHLVTGLECIGYKDVYNLEIEDTHRYIANELCVKNSRAPNLQNLTRDGFVKEAFVSRWGDDGILLEVDYKQLELFVMAIVSQDPLFVHAFTNGIDLHKKVAANIVFRCNEKDVSKQMRTMAKTVNFGMIYGKTPFTLKDDLNVTEEEAKRILEGYFVEYSGVKSYCDRVKNFAQTNGYVTTVMGRRRYLDYSDRNGADRQAVNTTIQSPASDVCVTAVNQLQVYFAKIADDLMVKLVGKVFDINSRKKEGAALVCGTVHDSILVDCKKKYVNEIVQSAVIIMEHTGLPWITIPLKVDVKYGPNLRHMIEWDGEEIIL